MININVAEQGLGSIPYQTLDRVHLIHQSTMGQRPKDDRHMLKLYKNHEMCTDITVKF